MRPHARAHPRAPEALPVLAIGSEQVEWLGRGTDPTLGTASVSDARPASLAAAAHELCRGAGDRPGRCLLLLGEDYLKETIVRLPPLDGKDLRPVLQRKAAGLVGVRVGDLLYSATPLAIELAETGEAHWLLRASSHDRIKALRLALREKGLEARRIAWERAAIHESVARTHPLPEHGSRIVLAVESEGVSLRLESGKGCVHQTVLAGRLADDVALAAATLQALKSMDAFWRRESRGERVDQVLAVGLAEETANQVLPAIRAAFPGSEALCIPASLSGVEAARIAVLAGTRAEGSEETNLRVNVPATPFTLVAAALSFLLLLGVPFLLRHDVRQKQAARWRRDAVAMRSELSDFDAIEEEHARVASSLDRLAGERDRVLAVGSRGLPLTELLEDAVTAFQGRGALLSLACSPENGAQLTGETFAPPRAALRALDEIRERLERGPLFADVQIQLPTGMPTSDGPEGARLAFAISAVGKGWQ